MPTRLQEPFRGGGPLSPPWPKSPLVAAHGTDRAGPGHAPAGPPASLAARLRGSAARPSACTHPAGGMTFSRSSWGDIFMLQRHGTAGPLYDLSFAKTPPSGQVVDLSALMRRQSELDDHSPAPSASTPPVPLRRPPPARPREPRLAPPARRVQANGAPAQASPD